MKSFIIFIGLTIFLLVPMLSLAQGLQPDALSDINSQNEVFLGKAGLGTGASVSSVISRVIRVVLSFLGIIFLVLIIYAGFTWMTAAGNEDNIRRAKMVMTAAVIGLAIVLGAYIITYFILDKALEATKGGVGLD